MTKTLTQIFKKVTPESAEDGDYAEQGETGREWEFDYAEEAYDFLSKEGANEWSDGKGVHRKVGHGWWSTVDPDIDYSDGSETYYDYSPEGFSEEEIDYINRRFEGGEKEREFCDPDDIDSMNESNYMKVNVKMNKGRKNKILKEASRYDKDGILIYVTSNGLHRDEVMDFLENRFHQNPKLHNLKATSFAGTANAEIYVSGPDDELDEFVNDYTSNFDEIVQETDVEENNWTDPVDLKYYMNADFESDEIQEWLDGDEWKDYHKKAPGAIQKLATKFEKEMKEMFTHKYWGYNPILIETEESGPIYVNVNVPRGVIETGGDANVGFLRDGEHEIPIHPDEDLTWHLEELRQDILETEHEFNDDDSMNESDLSNSQIQANINIRFGSGGGYYGGSPNIHVYTGKNGKLIYEFSQPGWDFETESQFEAATLISGSKFATASELKDVPFVEPSSKDWEEGAYWLTGGNRMWRFHEDEYFTGKWDNDYKAVTSFIQTELKPKIQQCKTMFDLIQVISKEKDNIMQAFYDEFSDLFDYSDEDDDSFNESSLMKNWKKKIEKNLKSC